MPASSRRYDLLKPRIDRFVRTFPGVEEGDVRAIHRARVASRRLRELMPILQLDGVTTRRVVRRLRKVTRHLGPVRELDVLLPLIDELHESRRHSERALTRVADELRTQRHKARKMLAGGINASELRRVGRKLEAIAEALDKVDVRSQPTRGWRWALDARVARRASALRTAIDEAGAVYLPERLHSVRIALKKLRYAVELSTEAADDRGGGDLRRLKRSQELLGRLHDLQVLIDRVRQLQASITPPDIKAWRELDLLITSLENRCRGLHARYVRDRAILTALCDRLTRKSHVPSQKSQVA